MLGMCDRKATDTTTSQSSLFFVTVSKRESLGRPLTLDEVTGSIRSFDLNKSVWGK